MSDLRRSAQLADLLLIASTVLQLGTVDRATLHPDGRAESDTTHTVMLGLVAAFLAEREELEVDLGRLLLFALVHDLPEAYAGDVCTARPLTPDERAAKQLREAGAIETIALMVPWLGEHIRAYERQECPESRLVRHADKLMPRLTHILNGGEALRRLGFTPDELADVHGQNGERLRWRYPEHAFLHELRELAARSVERAYRTWSP